MLGAGSVRRALLAACMVVASLLALSATAQAQNADCGVSKPAGETAISSYATLQKDIANQGASSSATYYLTTSLSDSTSLTGGLALPQAMSVTIDLNGCALSITHPGTGTPAITLNASQEDLTVSDSSAKADGTLTATGGAASSTQGAAAGIGGPDSQSMAGSLEVAAGTVTATGGAASSGATTNTGSGAGVGGGGGNSTGASAGTGGTVTVDAGAKLIATGGAATATSVDNGGAGAGIGGGGGPASEASGQSTSVYTSGTTQATGGSTSAPTDNGGPGAGIGSGGAGSSSLPQETNANLGQSGGTLTVSAGKASSPQQLSADGFGNGGAAKLNPGANNYSSATFSGTSTVSGVFDSSFQEVSGATLNVTTGASLVLSDPRGNTNDAVNGALNLPATSTLEVRGMSLVFPVGTYSLAGHVLIDSGGEIDAYGGATLTMPQLAPVQGELRLEADSTLEVPSSQTVTLDSDQSVNAGLIDLSGTLTGSGSLANSGTILFDGTAAKIPGDGQGQNGQLTITGNAYDVTYTVPSPNSPPASEWLFAPSFAAVGESLPAEPALSGYTVSGNWLLNGNALDDDGDLTAPAGVVTLVGNYVWNTVFQQIPAFNSVTLGDPIADTVTAGGTAAYGTPTGSVSFSICGPLSGATGCSSTATPVGNSAVALRQASGTTATATSDLYLPTQTGTYCFEAVYTGDSENEPVTGSEPDGCFSVVAPASSAGTGSGGSGGGTTTVTTTTPAPPTPTPDATATATPTIAHTPVTAGTPVALSASVSDTSNASTTVDDGEVAFFLNGDTTLCLAEVVNGHASCETSALPAGNDTITARYEGLGALAQSVMSAGLHTHVLANNHVSVLDLRLTSAHRVNVTLRFPSKGTVHIRALDGRRLLASDVARARHSGARVTTTLTLGELPRTGVLRIAISFTPTGGHTRTVTRTLALSR